MLKNPASLLETEISMIRTTLHHVRTLGRIVFIAAVVIATLLMGNYTLEDSPDSIRLNQIIDFDVRPNVQLFVGVL